MTVYSKILNIVLFFSFLSCTYLQLKKETDIIEISTIFVGYVSSMVPLDGKPIVVAAYSNQNKEKVAVHYTTLHDQGSYELLVPTGKYHIVAFIDQNRNLILDKNEPAGLYTDTQTAVIKSRIVIHDLDILISNPDFSKSDLPLGLKIPSKNTNKFHSTLPGAIADLDGEIFSNDYGKKGYWNPLEFFTEVGGNIYFLEPYDSEKIPLLFVHGASGSPQNWRIFLKQIDREKYQPWFFYYPSGATISSQSYLLYWKLFNLQRKYQFKEMYIIAHSMGGLVVRSFLTDWGNQFPSITKFISISTPWGGLNSAELGVEYSPVVIPVWKDIQPSGEFFSSLYQKELPATVKHYLFFGYKGNHNPFSQNNDCAVPIASQLDPRAQAGAELVYGFNEDHVSILSSDQLFDQINTIINVNDPDRLYSGGKLRIYFKFDVPNDWVKPRPRLLLRQDNKWEEETIIYLRNEDSGRELGPFPPGNYTVSLIADAFEPEPKSATIVIKSDTISALSINMIPRGSCIGIIAAKNENQSKIFSKQDSDPKIKIQKITLSGNGINRTLFADEFNNMNKFNCYLSGMDCLINSEFYFYNLPAGRYTLKIFADGFETYKSSYEVQPGQTYKTNSIELTPHDNSINGK